MRQSNLHCSGLIVAVLAAWAPSVLSQVCENGQRISGTILDPAQAAIAGAAITFTSRAAGVPSSATTTDTAGHFYFSCVAAGSLHIQAAGFAPEEIKLQTTSAPFIIRLKIAAVQTDVAVGDDPLSLDSDHGAGTHLLTAQDVKDLADDPDDFKRQLQVLAATSGGAPGQAIITVDGFQNGSQLPPKSSIASIRVNPDMFSSEYEEPPYRGGRIEIYTKPGMAAFHGALFYTDSDAVFNANDPFSMSGTPAGKRRYGFELSGPIVRRRSDFSLALEKRDIDEYDVVHALVLGSAGAPTPLNQSIRAPQRLWIASARADWQATPKNNAVLSYSINRSTLGNQGVGGLSLVEAGYGSEISEQNLRLTNIAVLSPQLLHETRLGYTWKRTRDTPNSQAASLSVAGAFTGGGATAQALDDRERDIEIDDDLMITRGAHALKLGAEALGVLVHATDPDTFNGAYLFGGSVAAPNLDASGAPVAGTTVIDGLEQYRRALAGLPGGTPTSYQLTTGEPLVAFSQWRLALYAQETWKLTPRVSVSFGLRYALETSPNSFANFAPRVGLAWSPDKKQKWVVHLRGGLFSSPVTQATTLEAYRLNGTRQSEQLIYAPSFQAPLAATPGSLAIATTRSFAAHAGESPSFQSQAGIEHDLPRHWHVQANLFYAAAWDELRSRNINAPIVTAGVINALSAPRPLTPNANLLQYQQTGNLHGTVTFVGLDQHSYKRFGLFVGYLHFNLRTDADTAGEFAQSAYSDHGEMARANWESTHRVFAFGQLSLPYKVSLSSQFDAASGLPYNLVTGIDNNGDGVFNDRPSYASAPGSSVYATRFGNLSTTEVNGDLPRNAGTMPTTVHLDMNVSRAFTLGGKSAGDNQRTLTLNARSANLLNHTNVAAVGTVVSSPTLSQPLAAETARRVEFGARFSF